MKKLSIGLLVSLLFYLFINYIFISKSNDAHEDMEGEYDAYYAERAHVLTQQARIDAFNSSSSLTLKNDTQSDVLVKVMKSSDDSEYMIFMLRKGMGESTSILPGNYYLKMRYNDGKKFVFQKGYLFNINESDQTKLTIKKVFFSNNGSSLIHPPEF